MTDAPNAPDVPPAPAAPPRPSGTRRDTWRAALAAVLAIVAVTLIVYWPVLGYEFLHWDDTDLVIENPLLRDPPLATLQRIWTKPYQGLYTPLAYTAWALIAATSPADADGGARLAAGAFHALNLALHVASSLLVFAILRLLGLRDLGAAAGALLFALHPLQVEPVAWVSGMNGVLCGTFGLLAIALYVGHARSSARWRAWLLIGAGIATVAAMLAKPTGVTVPLIIGAIELLLLRRGFRRTIVTTGIGLALALPVVVIARVVQPSAGVPAPPLWQRPLVATDALAFYLVKLAWPAHLAVDYGRTPGRIVASGAVAWTWVAPAALAIACWLAWRRGHRWVAAGAAVFTLALLPVLGLVPFDFQRYSTVADRYVYLAMLGPAIVVAYALRGRLGPGAMAAVVIVLAVLAVRTHARVREWRDERTLFGAELARNPDSLAAHQVLGTLAARDDDFVTALHHYTQATRINPGDGRSQFNLANLLLRLDRPEAAIEHYRAALAQFSRRPDVHNNLGIALMQLGRTTEAAAAFQRALELQPTYPEARRNLDLLLRATPPTLPSTGTTE